MADINALKNTFFVNIGDVVQADDDPSDPDIAITAATRPETSAGCRATYLIDGQNYFAALRAEINALTAGGTDRFFYTTSWHLGTTKAPDQTGILEGSVTSAWAQDLHTGIVALPPFELQDGNPPYHPFSEDLKAMVAAGVDVRLLVWASPFLVNFKQAGSRLLQMWSINIQSLQSVLDLRQLPGMLNKVVLNTLAHPLSAMHIKMTVCGDSTGFRAYASGIDFVQNRNTPPVHDATRFWHDLTIKVEGAGADALHGLFVSLWNEVLSRSPKVFKAFKSEIPSYAGDPLMLDPRTNPPGTVGPHHTQVLRTMPTMKFTFLASDRLEDVGCIERLVSGFKQPKLSFAPGGIFEFRAAQRKAVNAAQEFIYIEDQAFWNIELADWINGRLKLVPGLKVILMHMGDPLDPPSPLLPDMIAHLIAGLPSPMDRVALAFAPYTIHSKVTIIDDKWASIGSSNCIRRSFYMEGEVSVSVLDETEPSFASSLRKDLWGEHCGKQPGADCDPLRNLSEALGLWNAAWGTPPAGFSLRADITVQALPMAPHTPVSEKARDIQDGDSRLEY